jgi:hypothetical protein
VPKHYRMVGLCALLLLISSVALGQSTNATITGQVADPSKAVLPQATIRAVNNNTNVRYEGHTNQSGTYVISSLPPGDYRLEVEKTGFRTIIKPDIILHVQDTVELNFEMAVGSASETVTVSGGAPLVNTQSAAVSTVVDLNLVKNLPLNGRSFQTLFQLTPGVVITATNFASQGQFSVNGQRSNANYLTVDGVSANVGIAAGNQPGQSMGGSLPALSASGGTNSLVSTDAVQEFAIQTSSYAPEFGRTPGGQVTVVSKSGTNGFHGTAFDYFRNESLDANDWFANHDGIKRAALRQNDFGGIFGGPIHRDNTFFFFSYEGLRLRQPTVGQSDVPSVATRSAAPIAMRPFFNAYPLPTGPDEGNGLAPADYGFSNPSTLDAVSLRVDQHFNQSLAVFGRYDYAPSKIESRGANEAPFSVVGTTAMKLQTLTLGATYLISARSSDEFRFNWSRSSGTTHDRIESFAGAIAPPSTILFPAGFSDADSFFGFLPSFTGKNLNLQTGRAVENAQNQINLIDNVTVQLGTHFLKFGVDYRHLTPDFTPPVYVQGTDFDSIPTAISATTTVGAVQAEVPVESRFDNYSLFAQDTWHPFSRLTVTYGLRWDFNPTPTGHGRNGLLPAALQGTDNLATIAVAPQGTPIYHVSWGNFAPRLGLAYRVANTRLGESVIRAGTGVFYDLGNGPAGNAFGLFFPFVAVKLNFGVPFPLSSSDAAPPPITSSLPATGSVVGFNPSLRTPYTYHVNGSFEQALGNDQSVSLTYVGAFGHSLLRTEQFFGPPLPPTFESAIFFTTNQGYSKYNALQAQFRRRTSKSLDLIASYTYSHSNDNVSSDAALSVPGRFVNPQTDFGPSDFDVRHTLSAALDYQVPAYGHAGLTKALLHGWSIDPIITLRSSSPVNVTVFRDLGFGFYDFRPDLVPGVPLYIHDSTLPAGRAINPAALSVSSTATQGTLPRNFFRAFPLFQADLGIRRRFPIHERLALMLEANAFNVLNHPNFAPEASQLGTVFGGTLFPTSGFGVSNSMLGRGLQGGAFGSGFSPLYQIGGPRSLQLGLKLEF